MGRGEGRRLQVRRARDRSHSRLDDRRGQRCGEDDGVRPVTRRDRLLRSGRAALRPGTASPAGDPESAPRHDGPTHDQRRGWARLRRGDGAGGAQRRGPAIPGDRPDAPRAPAGSVASRRVPEARRPNGRRRAPGLRGLDDPGEQVRSGHRQRAARPGQGTASEAEAEGRAEGDADAGQDPVPADLLRAAVVVRGRPGPRHHPHLQQLLHPLTILC